MTLPGFSTRSCMRVACALLALSSVACGDDTPHASAHDAEVPADAPLPDDVVEVLDRRCHECHSEPMKNFAPFPLVTWQDTQAQAPGYESGVHIYEVMQMRIHDEGFPMPPDGREMTDADRAVLDAWFDSGAMPGTKSGK